MVNAFTYAEDGPPLQSAVRGLYATPSSPIPFDRSIVVRSFLLWRQAGNILVYHSPGITAAAEAIAAMGTPERLLVNHWHESMFDAPQPAIPTFVHERDLAQTALPIAGTFGARLHLADDLEIIPTPGHTAGTAMALWNNGGQRFLFTGDTILIEDGRWRAIVLGESDRQAYLDSIALLMDTDFDVLVPWGGRQGEPYAYRVTRMEARAQLRRLHDRLSAGENA